MLGQIAAGSPILAEQAVEDVFPLPRQLTGEGELFMLKVVGESMIDAAICDGDWVVVRQQPVAENGEIVAAMIDGEATVKTFRVATGTCGCSPTTRLRADPRRRGDHPRSRRDGPARPLTDPVAGVSDVQTRPARTLSSKRTSAARSGRRPRRAQIVLDRATGSLPFAAR